MPQRRIVVAAKKSRDHVSVIAMALPLIGECNGDLQGPRYLLHACMYIYKNVWVEVFTCICLCTASQVYIYGKICKNIFNYIDNSKGIICWGYNTYNKVHKEYIVYVYMRIQAFFTCHILILQNFFLAWKVSYVFAGEKIHYWDDLLKRDISKFLEFRLILLIYFMLYIY